MHMLRGSVSKKPKQSSQNRRDLPRDNPLVSVEVLRYDIKRSKSENKGIVPTEMELVLEQTQQVGFNPLVHSFCALSTLRRSDLRTASAAAKPCQGDSLEFYLMTRRIPTVAAAGQRHVNSQPGSHAEEQRELPVEEKSRLFVELMDKRKKYFARLKA
ncbi:hypothetical protein Tco_0626621 [Tanacetum coccineum]|uniref:Uncharacterized protein n=1 Tax=Tanacetum coccineum TaxID=301880 RepID=A0ABQ4WK48_9ASTR